MADPATPAILTLPLTSEARQAISAAVNQIQAGEDREIPAGPGDFEWLCGVAGRAVEAVLGEASYG